MEDIILVNQKLNEWCGTKGINFYEGDTALGFLFKYAVPKVLKFHLQRGYLERELFQVEIDYTTDDGDEFTCHHAVGKDPALALFWAIWEVVK